MNYWNPKETMQLLKAAYAVNKNHHMAILVGVTFGLRVSEVLAIRGRDVQDGQLSVARLKGSKATLQPIFVHSNPLTDCSPLLERAKANPNGKLFPWSRQRMDVVIKKYGRAAGLD